MTVNGKSDYTPANLIREENLFYDLGYKFIKQDTSKTEKSININLTAYLLFVSIIMHLIIQIQQTLTITILVTYYVYKTLENSKNREISIYVLIFIFISHMTDYYLGSVQVEPGKLFTDRLTVFSWLLEITWVSIFTFQALISLQPTFKIFTSGHTVTPATSKSAVSFENLTKRLKGTEYQITELNEKIELKDMGENINSLIRIIYSIALFALVIDVFLWRIIGSFGGGENILEEYFISGLSMVLFLVLLILWSFISEDRE